MALQLTIEDGVPIPETTTRQGSNITFLKSMKPGQSTLFKGDDTKKAARFYRVAKKLGIPIEIHKVAEGLRMWRVEAPITEELKCGDPRNGAPEMQEPTPMKNITAHATTTPQKVKKLTEKQRKEAKNAKDRERRAKKKADAEFGRNV